MSSQTSFHDRIARIEERTSSRAPLEDDVPADGLLDDPTPEEIAAFAAAKKRTPRAAGTNLLLVLIVVALTLAGAAVYFRDVVGASEEVAADQPVGPPKVGFSMGGSLSR